MRHRMTIALKNVMSKPIDHDELFESFDCHLICWKIWNNDSTTHWSGGLNEGKNLEILSGAWNLVEGMTQLNNTWLFLRLMFVLTLKPFVLWQISAASSRTMTWTGSESVHEVLSLSLSLSLSLFLSAELGVDRALIHWGTWAWCERSSWLSSSNMIFLSLRWLCHRSPPWCWMLIDCLRAWIEDLTTEDDDFEHDLEEPNLMHSNDFDDSEEVLCADATKVCTVLLHEDEFEDFSGVHDLLGKSDNPSLSRSGTSDCHRPPDFEPSATSECELDVLMTRWTMMLGLFDVKWSRTHLRKLSAFMSVSLDVFFSLSAEISLVSLVSWSWAPDVRASISSSLFLISSTISARTPSMKTFLVMTSLWLVTAWGLGRTLDSQRLRDTWEALLTIRLMKAWHHQVTLVTEVEDWALDHWIISWCLTFLEALNSNEVFSLQMKMRCDWLSAVLSAESLRLDWRDRRT